MNRDISVDEFFENTCKPESEKIAFDRNIFTKKFSIELVKKYPHCLQYIPAQYQTRECVIEAISDNPFNIQFVCDQKEFYQIMAVNQNPLAIFHIEDPTFKTVATAVSRAVEINSTNHMLKSIIQVKEFDQNKMHRLYRTAVSRRPESVAILPDGKEYDSIREVAVRLKPDVIRFFNEWQKKQYQDEAFRLDHYTFQYMISPTESQQERAVFANPRSSLVYVNDTVFNKYKHFIKDPIALARIRFDRMRIKVKDRLSGLYKLLNRISLT